MERSFKTTLSEVHVNKSTQQWKLQLPSSVGFQKVSIVFQKVYMLIIELGFQKKYRLNLAFKKCRLNLAFKK